MFKISVELTVKKKNGVTDIIYMEKRRVNNWTRCVRVRKNIHPVKTGTSE